MSRRGRKLDSSPRSPSHVRRTAKCRKFRRASAYAGGGRGETRRPPSFIAGGHSLAQGQPHPAAPVLAHALDRKSTRLNSSHVKISYAVFCLKKQKKRKSKRGGCVVATR